MAIIGPQQRLFPLVLKAQASTEFNLGSLLLIEFYKYLSISLIIRMIFNLIIYLTPLA